METTKKSTYNPSTAERLKVSAQIGGTLMGVFTLMVLLSKLGSRGKKGI